MRFIYAFIFAIKLTFPPVFRRYAILLSGIMPNIDREILMRKIAYF